MEYLTGMLGNAITTTVLLSIIAFLSRNWFVERLRLSLLKEHSKFLEELQWERKAREQAEKVAEYLAIARRLREDSPEEDYKKANQLSWELAMWLPEQIYLETVEAIKNPSEKINEFTAVIKVRKLLLKENAGELSMENIVHHAPGIGKKS